MTTLTTANLTEAKITGNGVFDVLMQAVKAHLEQEFTLGRIRGVEYSTVYLGSLESTMRTALEFLLQREKIDLEGQLLTKQVAIAQLQLEKAAVELQIAQASLPKIPAEIDLLKAQTKKVEQDTLNGVTEGLVLQGQKCKLDAEYDVLIQTKSKVIAETTLLGQKVVTEQAQTTSVGVTDDSVVGRQKNLYKAQTDGFQRDAEQKAAKIMADTWNVRRTTDEGTVADGTNMLSDAVVGRAITRMINGIGA